MWIALCAKGQGKRLGVMMRNAILLLCVLAAAGCDNVVTPGGSNSTNALTRYVDKENGVICYENPAKRILSCVKVSGGDHG